MVSSPLALWFPVQGRHSLPCSRPLGSLHRGGQCPLPCSRSFDSQHRGGGCPEPTILPAPFVKTATNPQSANHKIQSYSVLFCPHDVIFLVPAISGRPEAASTVPVPPGPHYNHSPPSLSYKYSSSSSNLSLLETFPSSATLEILSFQHNIIRSLCQSF